MNQCGVDTCIVLTIDFGVPPALAALASEPDWLGTGNEGDECGKPQTHIF